MGKVIGVIVMVYGGLASLAGAVFTYVLLTATSEEFKAVMGIAYIGTAVLIKGIIVLILGYKTFKAVRGSRG